MSTVTPERAATSSTGLEIKVTAISLLSSTLMAFTCGLVLLGATMIALGCYVNSVALFGLGLLCLFIAFMAARGANRVFHKYKVLFDELSTLEQPSVK